MLRIALVLMFSLIIISGYSQSEKWLEFPNPEILSDISSYQINKEFGNYDIKLYRLPCYTLSTDFINYKGEANLSSFLNPTQGKDAFVIVHDTLIKGVVKYFGSVERYTYSGYVGISQIDNLCYIEGYNEVIYTTDGKSLINSTLPWGEKTWVAVNEFFTVRELEFALAYIDQPFEDSLLVHYKNNGLNQERIVPKVWDSISSKSVDHVKEHQFIKKALGEAFDDTASHNYRIIPTFKISDRIFNYTIYEDIRMMLEPDTLSLSLIFHNDTGVSGYLHKTLIEYHLPYSPFPDAPPTVFMFMESSNHFDVQWDYFYVIGLGLFFQGNDKIYDFKKFSTIQEMEYVESLKRKPQEWFRSILGAYYRGNDDVFYEQLYNKKPQIK
jgi:hypothetical protein